MNTAQLKKPVQTMGALPYGPKSAAARIRSIAQKPQHIVPSKSKSVGPIKSIAKLESLVNAWEKISFDVGLGYPHIWYRGQSRVQDPQPGILRPKFLHCCDNADFKRGSLAKRLFNREITINIQFRRMVASLVPAGTNNMDLYFLAQHYGLPTRLLDWSMNPLAALYFAVSGEENCDGALYVLNPKELGPFVDVRRNPEVKSITDSVFGDCKVAHDESIRPLMPDLFAGRMLQQSSCFTLHPPPMDKVMNKQGPVTPNVIPGIELHVIPKKAKSKLRLTLRRLGVTDATLFPDLDHVTKEIRDAWKL